MTRARLTLGAVLAAALTASVVLGAWAFIDWTMGSATPGRDAISTAGFE